MWHRETSFFLKRRCNVVFLNSTLENKRVIDSKNSLISGVVVVVVVVVVLEVVVCGTSVSTQVQQHGGGQHPHSPSTGATYPGGPGR